MPAGPGGVTQKGWKRGGGLGSQRWEFRSPEAENVKAERSGRFTNRVRPWLCLRSIGHGEEGVDRIWQLIEVSSRNHVLERIICRMALGLAPRSTSTCPFDKDLPSPFPHLPG